MIIDSHQHVMVPTKLQLKKLREAKVDKAILFCSAIHPERTTSLNELTQEMTGLYKVLEGENSLEENIRRMKNNILELSAVVKKYPDKFYGFGLVPLGLSLEETIKWIKKYIVSNSLKGVGEFTPGTTMQVQQLEIVFEALTRFPKLPIWIHTFHPVTIEGLKMLMKISKKHPSVPVIFGHLGGYYWMDVIKFAKETPNVYLDLSAAFSSLAVKTAILESPDRCLYSSDAPYGEPILCRQLIEYVSPTKEIKDKVLGGNILKLLAIEKNNGMA